MFAIAGTNARTPCATICCCLRQLLIVAVEASHIIAQDLVQNIAAAVDGAGGRVRDAPTLAAVVVAVASTTEPDTGKRVEKQTSQCLMSTWRHLYA